MALNFPNAPANGDTYSYQVNITNPADPSTILLVRDVLYTYSSAKDSWKGAITQSSRIADPSPSEVTASPPFSNAGESDAGTQGNPYVITAQTAPTPGGTINSTQQITFTNQVSGERILFQDFSGTSNTRFQQFLLICDGYGNATTNIRYEDDPTTPQEQDGVVYTALLKVGNVWFTWEVTQQVAQPIVTETSSQISVTGNVWNVGQVANMVPGTIKSGTAPYTYTYKWQRSQDGSVWTDVIAATSNTSALSYPLTQTDTGYFLRGVTTATDSTTPVNQTLTLNSGNSLTQVQGPPKITEVLLKRQTQSETLRFTNQQYSSIITLSNLGTGGNTKSIKATFSLPNQTLRYGVLTAAGAVTGVQTTDPGFVTTTQQGNIALTFPSTFTDATVPDTVLPEGTSMITTVKASNSFGDSILTSNSILPELGDVVAFPTPDYIGSELTQYVDPFVADETPFNSGVGPLGSNKAQYGLAWNASPTAITFDPAWDVSAKPITQFQGGGAVTGINDVIIIFTDNTDTESSVIISTQNADWSLPITFADYSFTPPTTIKKIVIQSLQVSNKLNGLVGFYAADDSAVIYETIAVAQTRLTNKKTGILSNL